MIHKNIFFTLILCAFVSTINASETTKETPPEVNLESEIEQFEALLKAIGSREFLEAVIIGIKEGMQEALKNAALDTDKTVTKEQKDEIVEI